MITKQINTEKYKTLFSKIGFPYKIYYSRKDCSNDPFFIKKDEASQKRLEKVGFPKEILDRMELPNKK